MEKNDSNVQETLQPLPCLVSILPSSSTNRRRLSTITTFNKPSRPISMQKPIAWISLQGLLLNADEASSARTIGGGLTAELALAWDLFPPIYRFLIVAVIGAAAAHSHKNHQIANLKKSVERRDQVLSSMQQKLDSLCEQLSSSKENATVAINKLSTKDTELQLDETFGTERIKFVDCGCWHCEEHSNIYNEFMDATGSRASCGNEALQYKTPFFNEEQEERRMSDLSDLASSVTSASDIQLSSFATEQDFYNLKRDCEEKETTIKELTTRLNYSGVANSKRVAELEDIIRRKNTTISRLQKDLVVLEQKVMQLTRLRRPSYSASNSNVIQLPQLRDNLIYDMESTTSPSSSDSDSSPVNNAQDRSVDVVGLNQSYASAIYQKAAPAKILSSSRTVVKRPVKSLSFSPKEIPIVEKSATSSCQKQLSANRDLKKIRRRSFNGASTHNKRVQYGVAVECKLNRGKQ